MSTPTIHVVNKRESAIGEYVGRPSPLGNPYVLGRGGSREQVIANYRLWLGTQLLVKKDERVRGEMNRLYKIARDEGELTLVCWCAPLACHADVIRELLLAKFED